MNLKVGDVIKFKTSYWFTDPYWKARSPDPDWYETDLIITSINLDYATYKNPKTFCHYHVWPLDTWWEKVHVFKYKLIEHGIKGL